MSARRASRRVGGALLAVSALSLRCQYTPGEEQARRVWAAYCDRVRTCSADGFVRVFGTYAACLQRGLDGRADRSGAACADSELAQCEAAILRGPCPALDDWTAVPLDSRTLPAPCARCSPPSAAVIQDAGAD